MELVFATNNKNKLREVQQLLNQNTKLLTLEEINCFDEIPETSDTLQGNALQKARYVYERYQLDCFADDTGLEIEALDNAPGVYSARYAGEEKDNQANMNKVLEKLDNQKTRNAQFRTVIALIVGGKEFLFEGKVEGLIREQKSGNEGFGYDPIFEPVGYSKTFAEMSMEEKNKISHRGLATKKLAEFINELI